MYIQQLYTNCLAQAAYYIESEGEALIIDPLREPEPYLTLARQRNARIRFVFETHFHADFVSGHIELFRQTGALIIYGPNAQPKYRSYIAKDKEIFELGKIKFQIIHTPGHTIESSCLLLFDENEKPHSIFTGDTLFAGDIGRPDLMSGNLSKEELAGMLFESLKKIKALPDEIVMYPGHGPGSACGKNIGKETVTTIGEQKKNNYALKEMSKQEFIDAAVSGLPTPPPYFFKDAAINISGYDSYETIIAEEMKALDLKSFQSEINNGALILDTRNPSDFAEAFIPGSVNIGLNGDFAVWAGTVLEFGSPIVLVTDKGKEKESIIRLARIGFDSVKGYLDGGFTKWQRDGQPIDFIEEVDMKKFEARLEKDPVILDVRHNNERAVRAIPQSLHVPLGFLKNHIMDLNKSQEYIVYCAGGYRSMIAASLLKRAGIQNVCSLRGGLNAYASPKVYDLT